MASVALVSHVIGDGPRLVIVPGLYGSSRNWGTMSRRMSDIRQVHALDARNMGESPWADSMSFAEMAEDVIAYMDAHAIETCDLMGHSLGGKTVMAVALTRPERINRLIVVDVAPVHYEHFQHQEIIRKILALDISKAQRRVDVEAMLAPFVPDPGSRQLLTQNLGGEPGSYKWRINFKVLLEAMPDMIDFPTFINAFNKPTWFVRGALSDYVKPEYEPNIMQWFPSAKIVTIEGAGHRIHFDQPDKFAELLHQILPSESR